jgi:hypothetical protein
MIKNDLNVSEYLTPRDIRTLPKRRGREASNFYPSLVEAFLSSNEEAMQVDVAKIGRKPETVRSALAKAIRSAEVRDKVRVSMAGDDVVLVRR